MDGSRADVRDLVVLVGGDDSDGPVDPNLPEPSLVIAADGGLSWARRLGLVADVVVGDLDSVAATDLDAARAAGSRIETHPVDKDRTDLAIALDLALTYAPAHVTVVGGHGGRLDHHMANLLLLAAPRYANLEIVAFSGAATATVVHRSATITGRPGDTVSLLPVHGTAHGVTTEGLRFPLDGEDLPAGSSRGVSNEMLTDRGHVRLRAGTLLAIRPGR